MEYKTISALAEPHRFEIVELLKHGPKSVLEITHKLKLNQPQVSKHLKVLANVGIVKVQPQAQKRVYHLEKQPFIEMERWINAHKKYWNQQFDQLDSYLKEIQEEKKNGTKK